MNEITGYLCRRLARNVRETLAGYDVINRRTDGRTEGGPDMKTRTKMATAAGWALYLLGVVVLEGLLLALSGGEIAQLTLVASTLLFAALLRPLRGRLSGSIDRRLRERLALRAAGGSQGSPRR